MKFEKAVEKSYTYFNTTDIKFKDQKCTIDTHDDYFVYEKHIYIP